MVREQPDRAGRNGPRGRRWRHGPTAEVGTKKAIPQGKKAVSHATVHWANRPHAAALGIEKVY